MYRYDIQVQGHLDPRWSSWFAPLAIQHQADGTTLLHGALADQAALFGLLLKIRDLNLTLLSLRYLPETSQGETSR